MKFTDAVAVSGTRRSEDGYLIAEARCVRTGIQLYTGDEVGKPDLETVRVYRGEDHVFAQDSLQSFSHAPITVNHPGENVTADNWKELSVGEVSTAAKRDGQWVYLPLILKDAAAIRSVEDGKRELSAGYTCELDWTPGVTADGEPFDAQQKAIKINHLALVDRARAGSEARIGDDAAKWGASPVNLQTADERKSPMADTLRKILVDGLQVETTDAGAAAIEKLTNDLKASAAKLTDATATHDKAIAAKDAEIAKKDAEIDELKGKIMSDADLDKRVQERAALIDSARKVVSDVKTDGLTDAEIRKAVVKAKLGDEKVVDKSDAYIEARFDGLVEDAGASATQTDQLAQTRTVSTSVSDAADKARQESEASMRDAWKTKPAA